MTARSSIDLSASIICSSFRDIAKDLSELKEGGIDSIHFDVMDGQFVPRFGLFPEYLSAIRELTPLPIHVHMMTVDPEVYVDTFIAAGASSITFHVEISHDIQKSLDHIHSKGVLAGLALRPETPIEKLDPYIDTIDRLLIMGIRPGILGQTLIPQTYERLNTLQNRFETTNRIPIEIDGGVTFETATQLIKSGASSLVCGTGTIFKSDKRLGSQIKLLRTHIHETKAEV